MTWDSKMQGGADSEERGKQKEPFSPDPEAWGLWEG